MSTAPERLAIDADGDAWAWQDGEWDCLTASANCIDDADLEHNYRPVTYYERSGQQVDEPKFMTVIEVAALLRVNKMTVYRLIHSGELPAKRVGGCFRVTEANVRAYIDGADA